MGYSQGAAVTVDTLCGGGGTYVPPDAAPTTAALSATQGQNVVVAVMMGDPRFVPGVTYEAGTNKDKGGVSSSHRFPSSRKAASLRRLAGGRAKHYGCAMPDVRDEDGIVLRHGGHEVCKR